MSCRASKPSLPSITTRASAEEKQRFAALAAARGLPESALALHAIRAVIARGTDSLHPSARAPLRVPATGRITVRLRPGDAEWIARRAAQRGMKPSTYFAALARAHLAVNPPLATDELMALKQSVGVLAGLGRLLAQAIRSPSAPGIEREELQRTRAAVTALEQRTDDLARAALISWESRSV
jgi:hypothetical protein